MISGRPDKGQHPSRRLRVNCEVRTDLSRKRHTASAASATMLERFVGCLRVSQVSGFPSPDKPRSQALTIVSNSVLDDFLPLSRLFGVADPQGSKPPGRAFSRQTGRTSTSDLAAFILLEAIRISLILASSQAGGSVRVVPPSESKSVSLSGSCQFSSEICDEDHPFGDR